MKKLVYLTGEIMSQTLSSHMEDYLEAIAACADQSAIARVTDIRDLLGVKTPSVTGALRVLVSGGYVKHEAYGGVKLTPKGRRAAADVQQRHVMLSHFLIDVLGVDAKTANMDACKMEHTMSRKTLDKLHRFLHEYTHQQMAKGDDSHHSLHQFLHQCISKPTKKK